MRRIDFGERPTSRRDLASWYSAALDAQAASGLSVAGYAARIGVSVPTLYQWRRRLAAPTGGDTAGAKLVEVTVTRPAASGCDRIVVRVSDGRRSIEVPPGFDSNDLRRVVTVLESC
jgi:hypothetical protein